MRKLLSLLVIPLIVGSFIVGCASEKEAASVTIGELHPLTGALAEYGGAEQKGGKLAAKHLKEAGYEVKQIFGDTETSAVPGVEAARRLIEVEGAQVLIGAAGTGQTLSIAETVSIPSEVPQISYASTSPLITNLPADEGKDLLFRTCPSDALQGVVLGRMAYDKGYKKVSVLYVNNPYGKGLNDVFKETFEELGGTVVASVPHDEEPAASYTAELRKATEGNPDALLALGYPGHATVYMKEAIEGDFIDEFLFCDGTQSRDIVDAVGAEAVEGMCGTAASAKKTESLETLKSAWKEEYGEEFPPLPYQDTTYDAVVISALAAYEAQQAGEELTPKAVHDHLRSVAGPPGEEVFAGVEGIKKALKLLREGKDIDYIGASGDVDFDENGDVVTPIEIWCYEGGEIVAKRLETP